jgi:hypothetical protein
MRGSIAKKLRKSAYGDMARVVNYRETNIRQHGMIVNDSQKVKFIVKGFQVIKQKIGEAFKNIMTYTTATMVSDPTRRHLQELKRTYLSIPRNLRAKAMRSPKGLVCV